MNFAKAPATPTDRINWLVMILTLSLCLVLAAVMQSVSSERPSNPAARRSSTFFADEDGMLASYLIAAELLPSAQRFRRPYTALEYLPEANRFSTIVLAGPRRPLSMAGNQALDRWLAKGGQLILACDDDWQIAKKRSLSSVLDEAAEAGKEQQEDESGEPSEKPEGPGGKGEDADKGAGYLGRHGILVTPRLPSEGPEGDRPQSLQGSSPQQLVLLRGARLMSEQLEPLVEQDGHVVAGILQVGQGRLVVIGDRRAFSNRRLGESSNAVWLIQTIAGWGNGRAAFDEYHQGFGARRSYTALLGAFAATPWGWACLQAAAVGLVYLLVCRRRFGRLEEPSAPDRRSPLQLVQARGQLLAAARARQLAVEWVHRSLNLKISRSLGYPVDLDNEAVRKRLSGGTSQSARLLREYLEGYRQRPGGRAISDQDLVQLGRSAGRLAQEFQAGSLKTP